MGFSVFVNIFLPLFPIKIYNNSRNIHNYLAIRKASA